MGFTPTTHIWFNGRLVLWQEATVHVLAHGLHYGTGVFEGIRSYETPEGTAVFRLDTHLDRLFQSAAVYELEMPYSREALADATLEVVRANRLGNAYLRPIAFFDAHTLSLWTKDCPVSVAIAGFPFGAYLSGGPDRGARVTVSPVRKFPSNAMPASTKACGQYINSARAVQEAQRRGFDEAILLNQRGEVSEGSGENIFVVRHGAIATNDADADILMGVTRDTVLALAADLSIATRIGALSLEDLMAADELFFSGTAAEVTPIREIDGHVVGDGTPGPITRRIQRAFDDAVHGRRPEYRRWLSVATQPATTRSA